MSSMEHQEVNLGQQPTLQILHLRQRDLALEDGFLDALPRALTDPCDASQPAATRRCLGVDVIADDHEHVSLPRIWRQSAARERHIGG